MTNNFVSEARNEEILHLLEDIEKRNTVSIIHAVESGSRAWGFPSKDSDYDIRFIYYHPLEWYITAFNKKDYIELTITDDLDPSGWDIGKCLRLLYKGNAALHEWINSPAVYRSSAKMQQLKELADNVFYVPAAYYHYLSLAKKKLATPETASNSKAFLYCLRALLCAKWIAEKGSVPPVLFSVLVEEYLDMPLKNSLTDVLTIKAYGAEIDQVKVPEALMGFSINLFGILSSLDVSGKK